MTSPGGRQEGKEVREGQRPEERSFQGQARGQERAVPPRDTGTGLGDQADPCPCVGSFWAGLGGQGRLKAGGRGPGREIILH